MELPTELEMNIISFVPEHKMGLVCKEWLSEINAIRKRYANFIGEWYRPIRSTNNYDNVTTMVRYLVIHYPDEYFLSHPEYAVQSLSLNPELLTTLPPISTRKRSDIRDWMLTVNISFIEWTYIGI